MNYCHALSETTAPARGGVLRRSHRHRPTPLRGAAGLLPRGATAAQAAARFGYAESSVQAMVRDFRAGDRDFFARRRPGPATAPAKQAARAEVLRLRQAGHSITEIT